MNHLETVKILIEMKADISMKAKVSSFLTIFIFDSFIIYEFT